MRILYVCSDPSIRAGGRGGGFTTHMEEMIHSFRKLGHEVVVLDTKRESEEKRDPGERRVSAEKCGEVRKHDSGLKRGPEDRNGPLRKRDLGQWQGGVRGRNVAVVPRALRVLLRDGFYVFHNALFYSRIATLLKEQPPFDFVYERYCIYQFSTSMAAGKWRVPLVLEFNASIDETRLTDGLGLGAVAARVERMVTRRADAVVAVSGVLKEHLVGLGLPPEKVHVVHNGVNLERFCPDTSGDEIRRRFNLASEDVVVGFVGGFSVWHGAHLLLEVAPLATRENKKLRFFMVGGREGNPRFEDFRERVKEEGLSEVFRFAGEVPREDVPEHIAAMDITIIPWATDYGSPTKTFEYMGMAKALVAPRVAPLEEVLEHEKTALLVAPGDVQGIARALVSIAADSHLRKTLGRNARKAVEDKYNWDRNAAATIEVARSIISGERSQQPGTGRHG